MPRIICLSDTHGRHNFSVPDGDVLVHAGDLTMMGTEKQMLEVNAWLGTLPHPHKVIIAGNHDWGFQKEPLKFRQLITNAHYLQDSEVTVAGVRIFGQPWQPFFFDWAFNLPRGTLIRQKWDMIPQGIDVLLTHGPAYGFGDWVQNGWNPNGENVGCRDLLDAIIRARPKLHVSGHIHPGHGEYAGHGTIFVNAAICDDNYAPTQEPIVIDL